MSEESVTPEQDTPTVKKSRGGAANWITGLCVLNLLLLQIALVPGNSLMEILNWARLPLTLAATVLFIILQRLNNKWFLILLPVLIAHYLILFPLFNKPQNKWEATAATNEVHSYSILTFNTAAKENTEYVSLAEQIDRQSPDLICLQGLTKPWLEMMEHGLKGYPYSAKAVENESGSDKVESKDKAEGQSEPSKAKSGRYGNGIAIYSRLPITTSEVHYFGKNQRPRIIAKLNLASCPINVVVANPSGPRSSEDIEDRNSELALIAREMTAMTGPKILAGDLNCPPWSPAMDCLKEAGLYDSEQGFGPQSTYPARLGGKKNNAPILPVVPIDHIYLSNDFAVESRESGPEIGSFHLPVVARTKLFTNK